MKTGTLWSRNIDEWETPQDFYERIDDEFHFNLDPCSTDENHKTLLYYTKEQDGLKQPWGGVEYGAIHHTAASRHGCGKLITNRGIPTL